jgi:hypothetical protein
MSSTELSSTKQVGNTIILYTVFFYTDIRQQNKTSCRACGDNPSAACVDGNFRLPRLESASKGLAI